MARKLATSCLLVVAALLAFAAALLAVAAASHSEPQTVNLTMIDYRFIPDHLIFEHDVRMQCAASKASTIKGDFPWN
jgi:hypothetical protein